MKRVVMGAVTAFTLTLTAPAFATDYNVGDVEFQATFQPTSISANIGVNGLAAGGFQDRFLFEFPSPYKNGTGSGTLSTSGPIGSDTDLDFTSVVLQNLDKGTSIIADLTKFGNTTSFEFANLDTTIFVDDAYALVVTGVSRGNGSYGGQIQYIQGAVPEASTWAMLLVGFGAIGGTVRSRRRQSISVAKLA